MPLAVATLSSSVGTSSAAVAAAGCVKSGIWTDDCIAIWATLPGTVATWRAKLAERHRFVVRFPCEFVVGHPFQHASGCLGLLVEFLSE